MVLLTYLRAQLVITARRGSVEEACPRDWATVTWEEEISN